MKTNNTRKKDIDDVSIAHAAFNVRINELVVGERELAVGVNELAMGENELVIREQGVGDQRAKSW